MVLHGSAGMVAMVGMLRLGSRERENGRPYGFGQIGPMRRKNRYCFAFCYAG